MLDLVLIDSLYLAVGQHETRVRLSSSAARISAPWLSVVEIEDFSVRPFTVSGDATTGSIQGPPLGVSMA